MKLLALVIVLAFAAPAAAQPKKVEAEAAYKEGQARYLEEDYDGAAAQFKLAYELDPDAVYLFNAAQAYRLAKRCAQARDYYQRFLDQTKNPPNADAVKAYIVEVDECAKNQPVSLPPTEPSPPVVVEPPPEQPTQPEGGSRSQRVAGIVIGVAGVLLVGNGFYFMKRVGDAEDDANTLKTGPCGADWNKICDDKRGEIDDRGELSEKVMIGSFIGGGAAIATGIVLYMLGRDTTREAPVAVTPINGGAMVSIPF